MKENLSVAAHLVGGYLGGKARSYDELGPGEAAILKIDGDNVAAFRDEQGALHAVSAVCTHMGCLVGWNDTDRTWDCPCHGSRFELSGEVIHGPATKPLGSKITGVGASRLPAEAGTSADDPPRLLVRRSRLSPG